MFRDTLPEFLRMIAAHELARLREPGYGKAFQQLCLRMEPDHHRCGFDTRLRLAHLEATGEKLWASATGAAGRDSGPPGQSQGSTGAAS